MLLVTKEKQKTADNKIHYKYGMMILRKKIFLSLLLSISILLVAFFSQQETTKDKNNTSSFQIPNEMSQGVSLESKPRGSYILDVPFTAQAPLSNWGDSRQQNGCEEAAVLMAMAWVRGKTLRPEEAEKEIIAIADYELENYGHFHDTSAQDLVDQVFKGYFDYGNVEVKYDISAEDIKKELGAGNLVLVPANGKILDNPFYTEPPIEHMVVVRGYDSNTKEFIVNDSGTSRGELFRYAEDILIDAIYDYPTGYHEPVSELKKVMIIVKK